MNIYGEKVMLRAMEPEDMEMLREAVNDPEIEHMIGGWSFPVSKLEQMQWYERIVIDKRNLRFIIEVLDTGDAIGMCSLTEIDWKNRSAVTAIKLKKSAPKRKGYASDALFSLMQYAFEELQFYRLSCEIMEYNSASIALHKRCGALQEGLKRGAVYKNGNYHNVICYGVLYEDFLRATRQTRWKN